MNLKRALHSFFFERDDPIGVRAFSAIVNAPNIGGFGEFLRVDQNQYRRQARLEAARDRGFFEFYFAVADFADFKGDISAGF